MTPLDAVAAAIRERLIAGQPAPLPGLGTLVRQHVSARIEEQADGKRILLPPGQTVGLVATKPGHTTLELAYARFRGTDLESTPGDYSRAMDQIEGRLAATGEVRMPGVGLLRRTSGGVVLGVEADLLDAVNRTYQGLAPVGTDASSVAAPAQPQTPPPAQPSTPSAPATPPPPQPADLEGEPQPENAPVEQADDLVAELEELTTSPATPEEPLSIASATFVDDDLLDEAFDDVLQPSPSAEDDRDTWASDGWTTLPSGTPPSLSGLEDDLGGSDIEDADFDVVPPVPNEDPAAAEPLVVAAPAREVVDVEDVEQETPPVDDVSPAPDLEDDAEDGYDPFRPEAAAAAPVGAPAKEPRPHADLEVEPARPAEPVAPQPEPLDETFDPPVLAVAPAPIAETVAAPHQERQAPEPPPPRRRFPWTLLVLLVLAGLAALAFEFGPRAVEPTTSPAVEPSSRSVTSSSTLPATVTSHENGSLATASGLEDGQAFGLPASAGADGSDPLAAGPLETPRAESDGAVRTSASQVATSRTSAQREEPRIRPGLGQAPQSDVAITPPVLVGLSAPERQALSSRSPIRPTADAWTLIVLSTPARSDAQQLSQRYARSGYRTAVLEAESRGRPMFRVAVGQFSSRGDAIRLRDRLPPQAPGDTWPLDLQTL
ncbi:SPOR domain-containing protein [Rubrivirga sp.]|uniref:SPOR domain-containing protein n=1 Tax=Rubrivirga sp. TaxID=1885344 RepID=UPI003C74613E